MDSHCVIIFTLLILIILYLLRERKNIETSLREEYNALYEEWKTGELDEQLAKQPPIITLLPLNESVDYHAVIKAIKAGDFKLKETL